MKSFNQFITETKMSPEDMTIAKQIIQVDKDDEPMGQAAGLKIKAARKNLLKKYGKAWKKLVK